MNSSNPKMVQSDLRSFYSILVILPSFLVYSVIYHTFAEYLLSNRPVIFRKAFSIRGGIQAEVKVHFIPNIHW